MPQTSTQRETHWQNVYLTKADRETSWHQDEPSPSLELIRDYAPRQGRILDVGGGSSVLAGRLAGAGFDVTAIDISAAALERAKTRNSEHAQSIRWMVGDITEIDDLGTFDVWHDRAVFHFLIDADDRRKYIELAARSIAPGGHLVVGTFALDGPEKCSGLNVQRYGDTQLRETFGRSFKLMRSIQCVHTTPWGKTQAFTFAVLQRDARIQ